MSGAPTPPVITEAFAALADPGFINTIPDTSADPQRASYDLGFPPQTMTPVLAGGKPMLGPDMNGILYALSSHTFYQETGKPYRYNAAISTAIGGYAVGTVLGMADGTGLWLNQTDANTNDPDAFHTTYNGWSPLFRYGYASISGLTGGLATLNASQYRSSVIILSGALVANQQVVFPDTLQTWLVVNNTSGAFTLTVKTQSGTGVVIPQGGFGAPVEVYGEGTNLYPTVAPLTIPTSVGPDPNTYVLRSNTGDVFARLFNSNIAASFHVPVNVMIDAGDGYLRKSAISTLESYMLLQAIGGAVTAGQVPLAAVIQYVTNILASAALTGTPTAPTPATGDNSTRVATTAFTAGSLVLSGTSFSMTFPGGFILKGGLAQGGAGLGAIILSFAGLGIAAFPTACFGGICGTINRNGAGSSGTGYTSAVSAAGMTIFVDEQQLGAGTGNRGGFWLAVGN